MKGMMDQSKLTLCMFMLVMITFNPFGALYNKVAQVTTGESYSVRGILCNYSMFYLLINV